MHLTPEQISSILVDAVPDVAQALKEQMQTRIADVILNEAAEQVRTTVRGWVTANVLPQVEAALVEHRDGLVSIGVLAAEECTGMLAEAFTATLRERLSKDYQRRQVFKALFD
jgi:hypothetical protein